MHDFRQRNRLSPKVRAEMIELGLIGSFKAVTPWLLGSIGLVDVAAAVLSLAHA